MTSPCAVDLPRWAQTLRAAARGPLVSTPCVEPASTDADRAGFVAGFTDELGNRPRIAAPFLSAMLGIAPTAPAPQRPADLDDRLWWAVHAAGTPIADLAGTGPLDPLLAEIAVESRTEIELSAMHALVRLSLDRHEPALLDRAFAAARWHLAELQPDNGTNHPWAIHVFLSLAARADDAAESAAALVHAQTLLHNCHVAQGRPDRLSACILWDAAATLDRL